MNTPSYKYDFRNRLHKGHRLDMLGAATAGALYQRFPPTEARHWRVNGGWLIAYVGPAFRIVVESRQPPFKRVPRTLEALVKRHPGLILRTQYNQTWRSKNPINWTKGAIQNEEK